MKLSVPATHKYTKVHEVYHTYHCGKHKEKDLLEWMSDYYHTNYFGEIPFKNIPVPKYVNYVCELCIEGILPGGVGQIKHMKIPAIYRIASKEYGHLYSCGNHSDEDALHSLTIYFKIKSKLLYNENVEGVGYYCDLCYRGYSTLPKEAESKQIILKFTEVK